MKAKDVMTRRIPTVAPDVAVVDAAKKMHKYRIGGLPVVEASGKIAGIVTECDLLRCVDVTTGKRQPSWLQFLVGPTRAAEEFARSHARRVADVMTPDPFTVGEETPIEDIVGLMEGHNLKRIPVVRQGKIVGIVSRASLMSELLKTAKHGEARTADDRQLRQTILSEMDRTALAPSAMVDVQVDDGVATLTGTIFDERDRAALISLTENVAMVRAVQDRLACVPCGASLDADDLATAERAVL
ncbi:MAG TPA: CBS domain-containing protein [Rhizomicrobium sp.]|jgi:CBS-domain-containing membrane protein|nr:CBS domain-containing protein [Rhizomicrobium sp.]